jgi:pilus assembly protein CpaE
MPKAIRTILLSEDPAVEASVADAFGEDALLTPIAAVGTLDELEAMLSVRPFGLVIVDVQPDPEGMIASLSELIPTKPDCRFVVIAESFDKRVLLESMQAGARHYLPKDWIGPDVVPICRELAEQITGDSGDAGTGGRIITVLSASGGCGATTFAVNLAAELGIVSKSRSLLVDFDLRFGGVATHLGVAGEYGLADLLSRDGPLDADLVRSTAVSKGDWLSVLLSPSSISFAEPSPLYFDELQSTLGVFRSGFPFTVLDAPGLPFEAASAIAGYSDEIAIVVNLSVKDLRHTRFLLEGLAKAGVDAPLHLFANRCRGAGKPITLKEAQETLEFAGEIRPLPDDEAAATEALHAGEVLAKVAAKSKLRKAIESYAAEFMPSGEAEGAEGESKKKSGLLGLGKKAA